MAIEDDAFDIQRALGASRQKHHEATFKSWVSFRDWAYNLEEQNERLSFAFNAYKTIMKVHHLCICGNSLPKGNNVFCRKCAKLPRDNHGFPIRKR